MKKLLISILVAGATLLNPTVTAQSITFPVTFSDINITYDGRTGVGQVLPIDIQERTGVTAVLSNSRQTYIFFKTPERGQEVYNRLPEGEPAGDSYEVMIGPNEYNAYRYYTSRARGNYFYMKRPNQPYNDTEIRDSYKGQTIDVSIKQNVAAVLLYETGGYRFDLSALDENNSYTFGYYDAPYTRFGINSVSIDATNHVVFQFNSIEEHNRFTTIVSSASFNGELLGEPVTPPGVIDAITYDIPITNIPANTFNFVFVTSRTL